MSVFNVSVRPNDTEESEDTCLKYGFVWVCLGELVHEIVDIPEINDADRYMVAGGSKALNVFCLRTVENFLDSDAATIWLSFRFIIYIYLRYQLYLFV